jgi:hypothetical protein
VSEETPPKLPGSHSVEPELGLHGEASRVGAAAEDVDAVCPVEQEVLAVDDDGRSQRT